MKQDIHPTYHEIEAVCVCGNTIQTGSILPEMKLDICSGCHPFFTGQQKLVDREGRVDKFKRRYGEVRSAGKKSQKDKEEKGNEQG